MSRLTVSPTDMKNFRKMVEKLVENADYDHGHEEVISKSIGGQKGDFETTNKGRADIKNRHTNPRYGDNAMKDTAQLEEDVSLGILDRLQSMLQKAGISDDDMRAGIDLTPKGMQKVAAAFGIAASEVPMLLGSLTTRLRDDDKHEESAYESMYEAVMNEDDERFGYEKDANGNVTVRDSQTGKQAYLQGSQATDLLTRLNQSPDDEQAILSGLGPLMEKKSRNVKKKFEESTVEESNDFLDEMKQSSGTFNFSWDVDGKHGTGTARYSFQDHEMHVQLLSVRDNTGARIQLDPAMKAKLEQIAHDFIRDENE